MLLPIIKLRMQPLTVHIFVALGIYFASFKKLGRKRDKFDEQRSLSGALDRARRQKENTIRILLE